MTAIAVPRTTQNVLAVAAGAAFLALLDTTVANLAVADVQTDFAGTTVNGATWLNTIYAVVFAALLAPAGRVADVVGRRTLLIAGVSGFTLFSLLCALAPSLPMLLLARALQGAAAAAMIPAAVAVVLGDTRQDRRAAAIGAWSAAGALAAAAGPALGGVLGDQIGWRAVFVINVPLGAAIVYGARQIPKGGGEGGLPDALGTLLLGAGVGAAALGISQGRDWGWDDPRTLATIIGGVLAAAAAIQRSRHHPRPALETKLWRSKAFATANVASLLYGAALFPWMLVGVLVQVTLWDYSPLQAGVAMTPGAIVAAVVAVLAARKPPKPIILGGAVTLAIAGGICTLLLPDDANFLGFWLPVGVLIGIGMGAITTGVSTAAALSVTPDRFAAAVGLNAAARQVGGALGVAVLAGLLGTDIASFKDIYEFCTLATLGVAVTGSRL
jgi:EmrB/QacA subfamily drug resistance transporter